MADITLSCGHSNYDMCQCGEPPEGKVFKVIGTDPRGFKNPTFISDGHEFQEAVDIADGLNRTLSKVGTRHYEAVHIDYPMKPVA